MSRDEKDTHETYIDLSWLNLRSFPLTTFEKLQNVQHIYLEGNKVQKLDDDFFPTFQHLQWLDIRNNELEEIPVTIANHPNLRVLLLEGNNLQQLPVELGSVPNLKGLQLKGNPISYPPPEVVSEGSSTIIQFLQNEWSSLQAESEPNTTCLIKSSSKSVKEMKKSKNTSIGLQSSQPTKSSAEPQFNQKVQPEKLNECMKVIKLEKVDRKKKNKMSIGWSTCNSDPADEDERSQGDMKKQIMNVDEVNEYNQEKLDSSHELPDYERTVSDLEYSRRQPQISSKMLRDIWMHNIRQVLEEQEAELQRQRDKNSLKKWQQEKKEMQQTCKHKPGETPQLKLPYGIDEELKMPSRKDLHSLDKKTKQKRRVSRDSESIGHESISSKVNSILCTLQELRKKRLDRTLSPRSEQETLTAEIKQITELQRSLAALKHLNYKESS